MSKKKWAGKWKEQLELSVELDPNNLDAREWLALYLLHAPGIGGGDKGRGTQIARETLEIDEVFGRLLLAYAYRRIGDIDLAIAEYRRVLELQPRNGEAYLGLGYLFIGQNNLEEAERNFATSIDVEPNAEAYEGMAYYYAQRELTPQVIEFQEEALKLNPLASDTRYALAINYQESEQIGKAIAHYEQLLALTPKHHKVGDVRKRLKKLQNPKRVH